MITHCRYNYRIDLEIGELRQQLHEYYTQGTIVRGREPQYSSAYCKEIRQVAEWVANVNRLPWLLLTGGVGTGKTTMALAIIQMYAKHGGCFKDGVRQGLQLVAAAEIPILFANDYKKFDFYRQTPMLAVDDLGVENVEVLNYGNMTTPMTDLLNYRYQKRLLTVLTSNLPGKIIGERYGERIADRLREVAKVVVFGGESYRKQRRLAP